METVLARRSRRRSGTCERPECRSSASPGIWAGRTRRCASSSPMPAGHVRRARERSELRLSLEEREEISRGLAAGDSIRAIAEGLGRSPSTVCREVNANGGRKKYRALLADRAACRRALRPSGPSSRSAGGCEGSSSASSRPNGRPSRSRRGWLRSTPIARRCRCPTRPSTSHCSSRAGERCERAPLVPAHRSGHAPGQGLHQGQRRPGPAQEHGDDLRAPRRSEGPGRARATGRAT